MPTDRPSHNELIEAVIEFLQNRVIPQLDKATAFHSKVAINVLQIAAREFDQGPALETTEKERLIKLLNVSDVEHSSLDELNRALCQAIAKGDINYDNSELAEHLWQSVIDKVKIDNPRYSTLVKALGE